MDVGGVSVNYLMIRVNCMYLVEHKHWKVTQVGNKFRGIENFEIIKINILIK